MTSATAVGSQRKAILDEVITLNAGPINQLASYTEVYYTSVQILIETLKRTKLTSPDIAAVLSDADTRALLLDFRDEFLHGGSSLGEAHVRFLAKLDEVERWALVLRDACRILLKAFFASEFAKERIRAIEFE